MLYLFALSSCKPEDRQMKFVSLNSKDITSEDIFIVTHADSTNMLPCIVMDDYVLVIKDLPNEVVVMKIKDYSSQVISLLILCAEVILGMFIFVLFTD